MDRISSSQRSENMRSIKSTNMKPEIAVRRLVHSLGYRFRLHRADLPGKPDLVLPRLKKVIFVHGCFWHQHCDPACPRAHRPRSNLGYWEQKLQRNKVRDEHARQALIEAGWGVLTVWECELQNNREVEARIVEFLGD